MDQTTRNKVAIGFFISGKIFGIIGLACGYIRHHNFGIFSFIMAGILLAVSVYFCIVNFRIQAREEWVQ